MSGVIRGPGALIQEMPSRSERTSSARNSSKGSSCVLRLSRNRKGTGRPSSSKNRCRSRRNAIVGRSVKEGAPSFEDPRRPTGKGAGGRRGGRGPCMWADRVSSRRSKGNAPRRSVVRARRWSAGGWEGPRRSRVRCRPPPDPRPDAPRPQGGRTPRGARPWACAPPGGPSGAEPAIAPAPVPRRTGASRGCGLGDAAPRGRKPRV